MSNSVKQVSVSTKKVSETLSKVKLPKFDFSKIKNAVNTNKILRIVLVAVIFVFSFALVDLLVQYLNNSYSVAIVNGVRITRGEFYDRLVKTYGLATTENLLQEELIKQGALKEGVTVSADDIQTRLNDYYNENGGRDSVLATLKQNNFTEDDVRGQIKIGLLLEKTLTKRVTYTDKDLESFFNQYKTVLYGTEKVKFADKKEDIKQYYTNKKIQDLKDGWIAELKDAAKIQNNISAVPSYGFLKTTTTIVKNLYNEVNSQINKK